MVAFTAGKNHKNMNQAKAKESLNFGTGTVFNL